MFFTNPNQDIGGQLKQWWQTVPFIVTFIFYATTFLYLLSWVIFPYLFLMVLNPYAFVVKLCFWQPLSFPYLHLSLLHLLFALFSYMPTACRTERRLGTVKYLFLFVSNNFIIGLAFVGLIYALSFSKIPLFVGLAQKSYCLGLWPIVMLEMVLRCNKTPDELVQFMCFPCKFKAKMYPWVFFLLFSLLSNFIVWDILIGILAGYLRKR
jgi:membrane associated rhomboid family serine protease